MRAPLDPHPFGEIVGRLLEEGASFEEPVVLRAAAYRAYEGALDDYAKECTPELMSVVETVFAIADWLEEERASPRTAALLCFGLDRPLVLDAMRNINDRALQAETFVDKPKDPAWFKTNQNRAPHFDERPAATSVKVSGLAFPKRL